MMTMMMMMMMMMMMILEQKNDFYQFQRVWCQDIENKTKTVLPSGPNLEDEKKTDKKQKENGPRSELLALRQNEKRYENAMKRNENEMKTIQVNSQPAMDHLHRPGEPKDFCRKRYENGKNEKIGRPPKCQNLTVPDPVENEKNRKTMFLH